MTNKTTEPKISIDFEVANDGDLLCCNSCGARKVYIRGRRPGMDNRIVCPTCMAETLDDIKNRLLDNYNQAYNAT